MFRPLRLFSKFKTNLINTIFQRNGSETPSSSATQTPRALVVEPTYSDAHSAQRCLRIEGKSVPPGSLSLKI
jgi:hypothetical protein